MILRLLIVNTLVYLGLKLLWLAAPALGIDFEAVAGALLLPPTFAEAAARPWTMVTYMFTQCDFRHLLVNMCWLGGFGTLLGRDVGPWRILALYVAGGLVTAVMFLLSSLTSFAPAEPLAGASGSVIALTVAAGVLAPSRRVELAFGTYPLRQIVPIALLVFFFGTFAEAMAHAGGLLSGVGAALFWRKRGLGSSRRHQPEAGNAVPDEYELLVAKVNSRGYEALRPAEQRRLYELTQNRGCRD